MKCHINNLTLICKKQLKYCTECHFKSRWGCLCDHHLLHVLCFKNSLIFLKTNVSDVFDL